LLRQPSAASDGDRDAAAGEEEGAAPQGGHAQQGPQAGELRLFGSSIPPFLSFWGVVSSFSAVAWLDAMFAVFSLPALGFVDAATNLLDAIEIGGIN